MTLEKIFKGDIPKYILKFEKVKLGSDNGYYLYVLNGTHIPEFMLKRVIIDTKFINEEEFFRLNLPVVLANKTSPYSKKEKDDHADDIDYSEPYPFNLYIRNNSLIDKGLMPLKERKALLKMLNVPLENTSIRVINALEAYKLALKQTK